MITISKIIELYDRLKRVPPVLDDVVAGVNRLSERIDTLYSAIRYGNGNKEKHFVMVLIEAERIYTLARPQHQYDSFEPEIKKVERITAAQSKYITDSHDGFINFQPDCTMRRLRFMIICDVTKVRIDMIQCANQTLSAVCENAPTAYYDGEVNPTNRISIQCSVR